jgi:hypothetical protein
VVCEEEEAEGQQGGGEGEEEEEQQAATGLAQQEAAVETTAPAPALLSISQSTGSPAAIAGTCWSLSWSRPNLWGGGNIKHGIN